MVTFFFSCPRAALASGPPTRRGAPHLGGVEHQVAAMRCRRCYGARDCPRKVFLNRIDSVEANLYMSLRSVTLRPAGSRWARGLRGSSKLLRISRFPSAAGWRASVARCRDRRARTGCIPAARPPCRNGSPRPHEAWPKASTRLGRSAVVAKSSSDALQARKSDSGVSALGADVIGVFGMFRVVRRAVACQAGSGLGRIVQGRCMTIAQCS